MSTDEPMVGPDTAAGHVGASASWLKKDTVRRQYRVPHYRIGHLLRFRLSELTAWLESNSCNGIDHKETLS